MIVTRVVRSFAYTTQITTTSCCSKRLVVPFFNNNITRSSVNFTKRYSSLNPTTTMAHSLLMIPGPIEFDESVLLAMSTPATSHVAPSFINVFGETLEMLRRVLLTKDGQPIVVSGSGTLGWDMVAANLVEPNESVLVLNTGFFGDRFGECLTTYGAKVTHLRGQVLGDKPSLKEIETHLLEKKDSPYKLVTITHVDTSTGVLMDIKGIAEVIKRVSPSTLICVDGVCSIGGESLLMDAWGIDAVITASQKALGCPPGLCVLLISQKALKVFETRKAPVANYFGAFSKWLPIMRAYESRSGAYFATPAVQLIMALHVSLKQILGRIPFSKDGATTFVTDGAAKDAAEEEKIMLKRFAKHEQVSKLVKDTLTGKLGLKLVATDLSHAANTLSAVYYPEDMKATPKEFLGKVSAKGVVLAGGLHPDIATKYFRIGHMHISATEDARGHIQKTLDAIESALKECGHSF